MSSPEASESETAPAPSPADPPAKVSESGASENEAANPAAAQSQSRWVVAVVAACALIALFWPAGDGVRPAPPGMLVDDGGRPIPLASRKSTVTLIHFWSTWCPPCLDEVPSILKLEDELRAEHHFALVMVAVDDDTEKVKTFLGDKIEHSLFDHDWKVTKSYGTSKLPETYLVVRDEIVHTFIGAQDWSDPDVRQKIYDAIASVKGEST